MLHTLFELFFLKISLFKVLHCNFRIQCDKTTRSGPGLNFGMEMLFSSDSPERLLFQIKWAKEILGIFENTPEIEVKTDDGSILRLELCKLQMMPCDNCIIGE